MHEEVIILVVAVVLVLSAVALLMTAMNNRRRLREMQHRERIAMIEKGLIPSPEMDPGRFEAASGVPGPSAPVNGRGERFRTAGVAMIGVGLALLMVISFTGGAVDVGIGVGGAWVMLGGAMLLNYFLISRRAHGRTTPWPPVAPGDSDRHDNVAP